MKKSSFETLLYSVVGVLVMLLILVAFNFVAGTVKQRVDLTKDKAYTLSSGTRAILAKLDTPIKIRFYYSSSAELPSDALALKTYAQQVGDLLKEYKQAARGKIILEQYDPKPDSDAEDSARLNGVEGQPIGPGERFYLGLSVSLLDTTESIPFLHPNRERLLEYDLSRAISRVVKPEKPVVGIMSSLQVFGIPNNPMLAQMGQRPQDPWFFVNELKGDFTVKPIDIMVDKIDDDVNVLMVIHPKEITDKTQFAIDQFLMRGGKLIAFVDAMCIADRSSQPNPMMGNMPGGGTTLDKLFKAWGVQFDTSKVIADLGFMNRRVRLSQGDNPAWLSIQGEGINSSEVVTGQIDDLWIPFAGAFTGTPAEGLKETVLLKSSKNSQLVESMMASMAGESLMRDFKASGTEYPIAIRLTGKFKTAFPAGKPIDAPVEGETNKPPAQADVSLKESKTDTAVVLVANTDMFSDQFCVRMRPTILGNMPEVMNGNLDLVQNTVENMAGDSSLIDVRSRATQNHPFTRIKDMEAKAEEVFQAKQREYEESKQEAQQKINQMEQNKQPGQRFIMSPEQQAERDKWQKKVAELDAEWRKERKRLARDKESLQNQIKWGNILLMPLVVAVSGIALAVFKHKRTSAK